MRTISDTQRRARLARRHAIAPAYRVGDTAAVSRQMVALHATELANVYLAVAARSEASRADITAALEVERSVVRQLAMRRTLFGFERELLPAVLGSASSRVATTERARLAKDVEVGGLTTDGPGWVATQVADVEAALAEGPQTTTALRGLLPELSRRIEIAPGKDYGTISPIANRVMTVAAVSGRVLRGANEGNWRANRPRWTLAEQWLGEQVPPWPASQGWRELVRRWLWTFGPGTENDLVWWLGATKGVVRAALAELAAVEVHTSSGPGYLLPDDLEDVGEVEPWAALLPVLDPTTMGWKSREFYLGEHAPEIFDRNGNGGSTAWWDGRIVGCWWQPPDGSVELALLEDVGTQAKAALEVEAERLAGWLGGEVVGSVYHSPLVRRIRASA